MRVRRSESTKFVIGVAAARRMLRSAALLLTFLCALAVEGRAQTLDKDFTTEQLEQLVAPIALYPDSLLAQVLMASTYPLEIVQAARWAEANAKLKGKALDDALQMQTWDPSVKSIVVVPQVLKMMNDQLDWTEMLGNAFLDQQEDVLKAVQDLRARADMNGTLKTTSQQTVSTQPAPAGSSAPPAIVIQSADPQVIYVPTYNPTVVYGAWPYPSYPPYYWYPPGYVASNAISFGLGVAVGAAIWGGCNWGTNQVNVNVNNFNSFNRTNITNTNWQHNADHRKGVPYANSSVAQRFGQRSGTSSASARDQFRGRAESGQLNLGNQGQGLQNRIAGQGQGLQNRDAGQGQGQRAGAGQGVAGQRPTADQGGRQGGRNAGASTARDTRNANTGRGQNRPAAGAGNGGVQALDGIGRGQGVRQESARGAASRNAMASARTPSVTPGGGARAGGREGARTGGGGAVGGGRAGGGRRP